MSSFARSATIADLPSELKNHIVELAAKQDEVYEQWSTAEHYMSTVGALFQDSKEWSELAAPFRFIIVKASRARPYFYVHILGRRSKHFKTVDLDCSDQTRLLAAFAVFSSSKRLQKLVLRSVAIEVCGPTPSRQVAPLYSYLTMALSKAGQSITKLYVHDLTVKPSAFWIKPFRPALRSLQIRYNQSTSKLITLSIEEDNLSFTGATDEIAKGGPSHTLTNLSISLPCLESSVFSFVNAVSTRLEHFKLEGFSLPYEVPRLPDHFSLPTLHILRLLGPGLEEFHPLIRRAHVPALRHLELQMDDVEENSGFGVVMDEFGEQLESARVHNSAYCDPDTVKILERRCSDAGALPLVGPDQPQWPSLPLFTPSVLTAESIFPQAGVTLLNSLVSFVVDEVEQAKRNND
ncbi:hypothetical protein JCM8547_000439 [Rhodosporidiobolus lusitaniae]